MATLEKITWDNWKACLNLKVTAEQDDYLATNMFSLAQSYVALSNDDLPPMTYAICSDLIVIGFLMMLYDRAEDSNYHEDSYGVLRFMIDKDFQGKAVSVYLSYHPNNEVARKLYAFFGFEETGAIEAGEVVARLTH